MWVLRGCLSAGLDLLKIGRGCCFRFAVAAPNVVVALGVARNELSSVYQLRDVQPAYGRRLRPQRESSLGLYKSSSERFHFAIDEAHAL
jgi:hypothetical protein